MSASVHARRGLRGRGRRGVPRRRRDPGVAASARVPAIGARLAKLTFAPDLLMTDGDRVPRREPGARARAGARASRSSRAGCRSAPSSTCSGRGAATCDGREPDRPLRQPQLRLHRRRTRSRRRSCSACAARPATRSTTARATGCRTTRRSRSSRRSTCVSGVGYDRAAALGPRRRASTTCAAWSRTSASSTSATPDRSMRLVSVHPGVSVDEVVAADRLRARDPGERARDARADRRGAAPDPRGDRPRGRARARSAGLSPCLPPSTPASAISSAAAGRSSRRAWAGSRRPSSPPPRRNAGAFGFLAAATIRPEEIDAAIAAREGADRRSPSA